MPASSSKPMNTPFGIGLSITSRTTASSGMPRVRAWSAICLSTSGVFT